MSDLIKREDAIKAIENLPNAYNGWSDAYDKAYIIQTLEEVLSAEPTVDKDYLVNLIQEAVYDGEACRRLLDLVEPKQGEWKFLSIDCSRCSECGYLGKAEYNYCPNCGARMKGAE